MSWYVNVMGTPSAVNHAVDTDAHVPAPIKQAVSGLATLVAGAEMAEVSTQGHFDLSGASCTGNATLIFKVIRVAREPQPTAPPPQDTAVAVVAAGAH